MAHIWYYVVLTWDGSAFTHSATTDGEYEAASNFCGEYNGSLVFGNDQDSQVDMTKPSHGNGAGFGGNLHPGVGCGGD